MIDLLKDCYMLFTCQLKGNYYEKKIKNWNCFLGFLLLPYNNC